MHPELQPKPRWWEQVAGLDLRSLAILRILLGAYTVIDAIQRLTQARLYLTGQGVTPRIYVVQVLDPWFWSLHLASDALWWQVALLLAMLVAGLCMIVGYRTGWATAVVWALTVSVANRNEVIQDGGDTVARVLLFWAMFVPLGAVWSVDALRRPEEDAAARARTVTTAGTAALKLQMLSIFFFAALLKTGDPWRKTFDATWFAVQWDVFVTDFGIWLRQFPELLRWLTKFTLALEFLGPLLLLVPIAPLQVAVLFLHLGLNVGFSLCMHLMMFTLVMSAGWLALMPGWLWDRVGVGMTTPGWMAGGLNALHRWLPERGAQPAWFERWPQASMRLAGILAAVMLAWNLRGLHYDRFVRYLPSGINPPIHALHLEQHWTMFAPAPMTEDGWLVIPGKLANGTTVDLFRGGAPVSWERPPSIAATYGDRRGRRFYWMVTDKKSDLVRRYYAEYLCADWDRRNIEVLNSFEIVLMLEVANPDLTVTPPKKVVLWEQKCN